MTRALILMSRLSDYMLNCVTHWQKTTGVDLHIVRRKVDSDAPFRFDPTEGGLRFYQREDFDAEGLQALVRDLDPQLILCFGWMDKDYLSIVRHRKPSCPAVMTMDNQWLGTLRQSLGLVWSRLRLQPLFDHVWVPGPRQHRFARKLGFAERQIHEGLYVANAANFDPIWTGLEGGAPTRRLVFTGRYVPEKGLDVLWEAFQSYHASHDSTLELWCIGAGALDSVKPDHPKIRHLGFVQPAEFRELLAGGGVFVLPSTFEPWGLVVQEFALAGFPLVLSSRVGAADRFLGTDNGILLPEVTPEALVEAIARIDGLEDAELVAMSRASRARAEGLTVDDWARQATAFLEGRA